MVSIGCKDCHWTAYTINGSTWGTQGTVTRYPSLYCDSCCGGSHSSLSYSGNIVRYECQGCSNVLYPVEWCDWRARPKTVYYGRCSNCRSAKERKEQAEARRREAEARRREAEARAARLRSAKTKPNYCPDYYSFSCQDWIAADYSIDSYNFLWTKCILYCKSAKRHCIYNQPTFNHSDITKVLSLSECPQCETDTAQAAIFDAACKSAKGKIDNLSSKLDGVETLLSSFKEPKSDCKSDTASNAHFSVTQIETEEKEITDIIQEFQRVRDQISNSQREDTVVIENIESIQTYTSETELDAAIQQLQNISQKCAESKAQLQQQIQDANNRERDLLDTQNALNNENKQALTEQNELNDINKKFAVEKAKLITEFDGSELSAKGDAIKELNARFDAVLDTMRAKFKDNQERINGLNECQKRTRKIRGKIKNEKSNCQYLIQLINEECQRIGKATDDAMDKFEERTNYFLSVTVGLKQEFVEQLIGYDLEDIAELTKDDLVNDFNIDKPSLAKLSRCIKKLKI